MPSEGSPRRPQLDIAQVDGFRNGMAGETEGGPRCGHSVVLAGWLATWPEGPLAGHWHGEASRQRRGGVRATRLRQTGLGDG